jgi:hypothetical protein
MNDSWKLFQKHCSNISINHPMHKLTPDEKLMHKIINGGRKNMNEWFERIIEITLKNKQLKIESQSKL